MNGSTFMLEKLIETLNSAGKPTRLYETPDSTRVLILPHGGRILGLYAPGDSENFLWTHPALESPETASAFYAGSQWQNSGGDRTWLAPEADFFFPNFPKLDKYWQPRELDPGNYQVDAGGRLTNRLRLTPSRSKRQIEMQICKSVLPAPNPLRYEHCAYRAEYAGYTLQTYLELIGGEAGTECIGLWDLMQLPHGGDLLVRTYSRSEPKVYMGQISTDDLIVGDHLIRYKMRAKGEHKIGIRAVATTGRAGYLYARGDVFSLVIRNYTVNPSGEYMDFPWSDEGDLGYSTQACNVNSGLGSFSELEYHHPAIGRGTGQIRCVDESQVWAFRGTLRDVQSVARRLLSSEI
jgi:hypothetical protein